MINKETLIVLCIQRLMNCCPPVKDMDAQALKNDSRGARLVDGSFCSVADA